MITLEIKKESVNGRMSEGKVGFEATPVVEKAENYHLGYMMISGHAVPYSREHGVGLYFSNIIRGRVNHQKPCNTIVTGEAGISKTYTCLSLARYIQPSFTIKQVTFEYSEFLDRFTNEAEGHVLVPDEPEYLVSARDWYKDINKILIQTLRSGRWKVHPLFIPCLNKSMLDLVIRKYLLQFHVHMDNRGEGTVYKLVPSAFDDSVFHKTICNIRLEMLDRSECGRQWCLSCDKIETCDLLRAQYERKRRDVQSKRYREDEMRAKAKEAKELTLSEIEDILVEEKEKWVWTHQGRVNSTSLLLILEKKGIPLSVHKASQVANKLTLKFPRKVE